MSARVFVRDWQYECCGDDFAVGDQVAWTTRDPDRRWLSDHLGAAEAAGVTHTEEHHGGSHGNVTGRVTGIRAVFYRPTSLPGEDPRWFVLVPGSTKLKPLTTTRDFQREEGLSFAGFLVDLA